MEYEPTNRDRNREADRGRMRVTGRGLLTIAAPGRPARVTEKMVREARKRGKTWTHRQSRASTTSA